MTDEVLEKFMAVVAPTESEGSPVEPIEPESESETAEEAQEEQAVEEAQDLQESVELLKAPIFDDADNVVGYEEITPVEFKRRQLMLSDYTKKTQAAAQITKEAEAKAKAASELADRLADHIANFEKLSKIEDEKINWEELRLYDTPEYLRQLELKKQRETALESAKKQKAEIDQARSSQEAELERERLSRETKMLFESMPEWKNDSVREADVKLFNEFMAANKYPPEFVNGITDHRVIKAFLTAAKYEKLQAEKPKILEKKVAIAPKGSKPGKPVESSQAVRRSQDAMDRFKKGDKNAGLEVFKQFVRK